MRGRHSTFIAVPSDVTDSMVLKRFLDSLVQKIDIAFSKRGTEGFASSGELVSTASTIEGLRDDVNTASASYLKKDSSNLEELHYTDIPSLTSKTLVHRDYVDTLYHPQVAPSQLPTTATNADIVNTLNSLIAKLTQSGILV